MDIFPAGFVSFEKANDENGETGKRSRWLLYTMDRAGKA
jgi:hypothetical protein